MRPHVNTGNFLFSDREGVTIRVAAGAALLDDLKPGWHEKVHPGKLNIASCVGCVIGQLYGIESQDPIANCDQDATRAWRAAAADLGLLPDEDIQHGPERMDDCLYIDYGFEAVCAEYEELETAWRRELRERNQPCSP